MVNSTQWGASSLAKALFPAMGVMGTAAGRHIVRCAVRGGALSRPEGELHRADRPARAALWRLAGDDEPVLLSGDFAGALGIAVTIEFVGPLGISPWARRGGRRGLSLGAVRGGRARAARTRIRRRTCARSGRHRLRALGAGLGLERLYRHRAGGEPEPAGCSALGMIVAALIASCPSALPNRTAGLQPPVGAAARGGRAVFQRRALYAGDAPLRRLGTDLRHIDEPRTGGGGADRLLWLGEALTARH